MKGVQGLLVAGFFGLLGVTLNWLYLQQKATDLQTTSFLGVRSGVEIAQGEVIDNSDLVSVAIPDVHARRLRAFAFTFEEAPTVVGTHATRPYQGGDFIYRDDYRTPPEDLNLEPDEALIFVPVGDAPPSLLNPGDRVIFSFPGTGRTSGGQNVENPLPLKAREEVGPFTIKSLGNRLSSHRIMTSNRYTQVQANIIGVAARREADRFEAKGERLLELLGTGGGGRNIKVVLLSRGESTQPVSATGY